MSRREIKACDVIDAQTGVCNREASGSCPICRRDLCPTHTGRHSVTVHVYTHESGSFIPIHRAGWTDVTPCPDCMSKIDGTFAASSRVLLQHLLPDEARLIEELKALLASESMKKPEVAGGA